jgi:hypothetical protein
MCCSNLSRCFPCDNWFVFQSIHNRDTKLVWCQSIVNLFRQTFSCSLETESSEVGCAIIKRAGNVICCVATEMTSHVVAIVVVVSATLVVVRYHLIFSSLSRTFSHGFWYSHRSSVISSSILPTKRQLHTLVSSVRISSNALSENW